MSVHSEEILGQSQTVAFEPIGRYRGSRDADHVFINNVRFLSMAAVICMHSLECYLAIFAVSSLPAWLSFLIQPFKFGTIAFFLASGFLFGERKDQFSGISYFKRRLRTVFLPWTFWFLLYVALLLAVDAIHGKIPFHLFHATLAAMYVKGKEALFTTAYWFVPNLLIAMAILLMCRRLLGSVWFGLGFLAVSLLYGVNIYIQWFPVEHAKAVFGFVFYIWLGASAARYFRSIESRIARVPVAVFGGVVLGTFLLAIAEEKLLMLRGSMDPMNSLRITNQIYSVVAVLLIIKLRRPLWPKFVDVRTQTYGLYLIHSVVILAICGRLRRVVAMVKASGWQFTAAETLALLAVVFVAVYGLSLGIGAWLLRHPRLRWTVYPSARKSPVQLQRTIAGGSRDNVFARL